MILKLRRSPDTEMLCFGSKDRVFLTMMKGILSLEDKLSMHLPLFLIGVLVRQLLLLVRFNNQFNNQFISHHWMLECRNWMKKKKILSSQHLHRRRKGKP